MSRVTHHASRAALARLWPAPNGDTAASDSIPSLLWEFLKSNFDGVETEVLMLDT